MQRDFDGMNDALPTGAPGCVVREAISQDAGALENLYRELVSDPQIRVLPEQIERLARSSHAFLLVAEIGDIICGTALLTICPDVMYGTQPFGIIENIVVAAQSRRRGVGRDLLDRMEQLAQAQDCTKLMLLSSDSRHEAHAFFQRCGFAGDIKKGFVKYRRNFATQRSE
jgi:N-acetylglutamate synthase-like GNAT family acetyltransferase